MFINGDRVQICISDTKHWNETVYRMLNGMFGHIIETSDRCRGDGGRPELKYVVQFDERIPAPYNNPLYGSILWHWFTPDELEMVQAVPGERCEHAWTERTIKNESLVWKVVSMERTCSKCGKHQVADCTGGNTCGKWEDVCEHQWEEVEYRDKNFGVKFGAGRKCKKCGKEQSADYTQGRIGGDWTDVPKKPEGEKKP